MTSMIGYGILRAMSHWDEKTLNETRGSAGVPSVTAKRTSESRFLCATLHFDGACCPNPGEASCGYCIRFDDGRVVENSIALGYGTNNIAEYKALIYGMAEALRQGVDSLRVYGDSLIVINGLNKRRAGGKPHLQILKKEAIELADMFYEISFQWIPRERNSNADFLSTKTLNRVSE